MKLRPTQTALLGVLLLAISLAGVPFFLRTRSAASVKGVVVDARGFGVRGASAFLFSEKDLRLVEEATTDGDGDFEFHLAVEGGRVFVRPPEASQLLPAWSDSSEDSGRAALVLHPARLLTVGVRDATGNPLSGAEVRVYQQRTEAAVLSLGFTDAAGQVVLPSPARAHVAALAPEAPHLQRWRFDLDVPAEGGRIELELPRGRRLNGVVRGPQGPVAEVVIVSWEEGLEGGWNGFARTDAAGRFVLPCSAAPTLVRALDPRGAFLPAKVQVAVPSDAPLEIELEPGAPLVVRTTRAGIPLQTQVWSWSPIAEAWGWSVRTSPTGRASVPVAERFSIRAEPLDPAFTALEAWDVAYEVETLHLEAAPRP